MITVTVKLYAYFREDRKPVLQLKLPSEAKIINILENLNIPIEEVGVLILRDQNSVSLKTPLHDRDIVTLIPVLGGG